MTKKKKIEFRLLPVIRVEINHRPDRTRPFRTSPQAIEFMRWCDDNDIVGFRGASTGPEGLVQYFEVEDSDKIRAYFLERGYTDVT